MKSSLVAHTALAILLSSVGIASHEGELKATQVTMSQSRLDASVEFTRKEDNTFSVSMKIGDAVHVVPAKILKGVEKVQFGTVKFLMSFPYGGDFPKEYYRESEFVLAFDYGESKTHTEEGEAVQVVSRMRLTFSPKRGLVAFERAVPQGNKSNKWSFSLDIFGQLDYEEVIEEQPTCPL